MPAWATHQIEHNMTVSALRMHIEKEILLRPFSDRTLTRMIFSDNSLKALVEWMTCLEVFLHKCIKWICKDLIEEIGGLQEPTLLAIIYLVMEVLALSQWEEMVQALFSQLHSEVDQDKDVHNNNSRESMLRRKEGSHKDSRTEIKGQNFNKLILMTSSETFRKSISYFITYFRVRDACTKCCFTIFFVIFLWYLLSSFLSGSGGYVNYQGYSLEKTDRYQHQLTSKVL